SPSIVVTRFPAAAATGITHDRTAVPSRCTVQAPHCAMPHPNFVPVRPRLSRSTHRSGVSGATSTDWRLPLTVRTIGGMTHSGRGCQKTGVGAGQGEGALLRLVEPRRLFHRGTRTGLDRKSTRLNSSHQIISYAVFCLKKKK